MPARKRQQPAKLGETDPAVEEKVAEAPPDLDPSTEEKKPEPKPKAEPEPVADVVVVEPEAPEPEPTWKPYPPMTDEISKCWICDVKARQIFKVVFRHMNLETKQLSFTEMDRMQIKQNAQTGEYEIISRM